MYTSGDHIRVLEEQAGGELVDVIISNSWYDADFGGAVQWVRIDPALERDPRLYCTDLVDRNQPGRHDAVKLAQVLMDIYNERTGPMSIEQSTQTR